MTKKEFYLEKASIYLMSAIRQHRHNIDNEELIIAFDHAETLKLVADLIEKKDTSGKGIQKKML